MLMSFLCGSHMGFGQLFHFFEDTRRVFLFVT